MKKKPRKKTEKTFKRDALAICNELRWMFCMQAYEMTIEWQADSYNAVDTCEQVAAEIHINQAYLRFRIVIFRSAYDAYLDGKLLPMLVHEFCHLVTDPCFRFARDFVPQDVDGHFREMLERETEMMTKLILGGQNIAELARYEQ